MRKAFQVLPLVFVMVSGSLFAGGSSCSGHAAKAETVAPKHGCSEDTQACLNKLVAKLKTRGWVGVELDKTHEGILTVKIVEPGSPADIAGVRNGDVLLALNGVEFAGGNKEALYAEKQKMKVGGEVTYTLSRHGETRDVDITLAPIPDAVMAKWVGGHLMDHAVIELAQN